MAHKILMSTIAAGFLATTIGVGTPNVSIAGEILPTKKIKKAFVKEEEGAAPVYTSSAPGGDPFAPLGYPPVNIPNFKGSYNAE